MISKIGVRENISPEEWQYRIDNLVYSQSLLSCFKRNRGEFVDKYIRNIFWSDETEKDLEYEKNMSYGLDFHLECQRIFMGISDREDGHFKRIMRIKQKYEEENKNLEFCPECKIETDSSISATFDLLVKIYDDDNNLKEVSIWDWKVENVEITYERALRRMQTAVYMYVVKETVAKNLDFDKVRMYYYQPGINKNQRIVYSEELHNRFKNNIFSTINEIKNMDRNEEYDEC